MSGTNNLNKNYFQKLFSQHNLRQYQIFTIFVRSAPIEFRSKIKFSENCLTLWRNTSFDEGNKLSKQKLFSQHNLIQYQIFTIFVRFAPVEFLSKIQFSENCLTLWRNTSFDEGNKLSKQKLFSQHNIRQYQIFTIFIRSAPVEFPSKFQFSKNCLKL